MNKTHHILKRHTSNSYSNFAAEKQTDIIMKKRIVETTAIIICSCLLPGCKQSPQESQIASYKVMTIKATDTELSNSYPASIQGRQDIAIYPQVSGTISTVCVKEGQRVRKGQSLFIIDQVPFKAALQMAQANVQAAEAAVATAQLVYDSKQALYADSVISQFDLQTSRNDLLTAKAQLAQAQAQEVTASNDMTYTMVQSPADGVVGTLPYREGALVSPSVPQPLTTVSDNSEMYVYFSISENKLLELCNEHGSMEEALAALPKVKLQLNNGSIYREEGYIETISGVIDASTGSVSVRAVFPNKGGLLHSGASGNIILPQAYPNSIVIPCNATFEIQDMIFVYKVVDGKAASCALNVLLANDAEHYIVTSGLNEGDVIVTEGVGLLRDGSVIETMEE